MYTNTKIIVALVVCIRLCSIESKNTIPTFRDSSLTLDKHKTNNQPNKDSHQNWQHVASGAAGQPQESALHMLNGLAVLYHHGVSVCCVFVLCVAVLSGHRHLSYVDKYHVITL